MFSDDTAAILAAPKGAKRVKLPVHVALSDLFFNYDNSAAWDSERECWRQEVLLSHAEDLLHMLRGLQAYPLVSAERLVEDFKGRL